MSATVLKRVAKWSLLAIPVGALIYVNRHFYFGQAYKVHQFEESEISEASKNYVQKNNLVSPLIYKNFQKNYKHDQFFEKSILTQMNGLNGYNVYMDKYYHDVITDEVEVNDEEKKKAHENAKIHCVFTANSRVQGHLGIVHGGFTSTLFDNLAGTLAFCVSDLAPAATAYLNVNYKKPMKIGKEYIAVVEVDKIEGKKIFLKGKIIDETDAVYTTIDSLFVKVQMENFNPKQLDTKLKQEKAIHDEEHRKKHDNSTNTATNSKPTNEQPVTK